MPEAQQREREAALLKLGGLLKRLEAGAKDDPQKALDAYVDTYDLLRDKSHLLIRSECAALQQGIVSIRETLLAMSLVDPRIQQYVSDLLGSRVSILGSGFVGAMRVRRVFQDGGREVAELDTSSNWKPCYAYVPKGGWNTQGHYLLIGRVVPIPAGSQLKGVAAAVLIESYNDDPPVNPRPDPPKPPAPPPSGPDVVWGGKGYGSYHKPDCADAQKLPAARETMARSEAVAQGLKPCPKCKPEKG